MTDSQWAPQKFSVLSIGELETDDEFAWVTVSATFHDPSVNAYPRVEFRVPVQYKDDWTIKQVRDEAKAKARMLLEQVGPLLAQEGPTRYERLMRELQATPEQQE